MESTWVYTQLPFIILFFINMMCKDERKEKKDVIILTETIEERIYNTTDEVK